MMTYIEAREALVKHLLHDASAHDAERFDEIGRRFDSLENLFPRGRDASLMKLHVAMTFWDGWIDARNNGWPRGAIAVEQWPALADAVAADLAADREISSPAVLERFDIVTHPKLNERVQTLASRLRERQRTD